MRRKKESERRAQAIKEARPSRAELRRRFAKSIVAAIEVLPFEGHDPMGINFETNTDGYRAEAESIVIRLSDATNEADAKAIVYDEFTNWFGIDGAGPRSRYDEYATRDKDSVGKG